MKRIGLEGRIAVEPLDDERLTNLERRIVARATDAAPARALPMPRFGWAMGLAAAAVIAIGAGFAGWAFRGAPATAVATAPVQVRTEDERATVDIGDATITSDAATAFTITRPDGGVLVALARGKVELEVGKRGGRAPLVVAAGDTRVIVVGTRFSVDYGDGTGGVDVRVTEGVVAVERHQQTVRVAAGEAWTTERGVVALAVLPDARRPGSTIALAPDAQRGGEDDANATNATTNANATTNVNANATTAASRNTDRDGRVAARTSGGDLAIDVGDAPDLLHERVATVPDARVPSRGTSARAGSATTANDGGATRTHARTTTTKASGDALDLATLIGRQPLAPPLDVGEPDPAKAVSAYRMIAAKTTGDQASHAFYSIALLQHTKLGRDGDALSTLDAYMRRFSGGKEYGAALWLRVRVLCMRVIDDRCRQAAYTYMRQAAGTPAAKIAERLTLSPR